MDRTFETKPLRWRKFSKDEHPLAKTFLVTRERFCVSASARFLRMREDRGQIWYLNNTAEKISALLLYSHQSLYPVFDKNSDIPRPRFLNRFWGKIPVHAIQGLREDTEILESLIEPRGYTAKDRIDFDLMNIDNQPETGALRSGPAGLILRPPASGDEEQLFALQSAYEQEEVLPKNGIFNPSVCRLTLSNILKNEQILVAELDGQVVGKINTSAESFTRCQIGGVYVRPDCRGRGIAVKMTAVFVRNLLAHKKGVTLFVKCRNSAAKSVYRKVGLIALANYRITYY